MEKRRQDACEQSTHTSPRCHKRRHIRCYEQRPTKPEAT